MSVGLADGGDLAVLAVSWEWLASPWLPIGAAFLAGLLVGVLLMLPLAHQRRAPRGELLDFTGLSRTVPEGLAAGDVVAFDWRWPAAMPPAPPPLMIQFPASTAGAQPLQVVPSPPPSSGAA